MKISFIGCKENGVDIFPALAKSLSKKISGLELEERFVPAFEDMPLVAEECAVESDFIFAFALVGSEEQASYIKDKLIDVEIKTETRILKAVEEDSMSNTNEENYDEQKEELVKKYTDLIVNILFNEREFEPEDKDFSI